MEVKKNPKKDLNRSSNLYFVAGLFMVLSLSYVALEWKTFYGEKDYDDTVMLDDELDEDVELVVIPPKPLPKPIVTPPVIEIVPDDEEIPETIIDAVEPDQDTEIADVDDIPEAEEEEDVDVPFILVEEAPIFPGCENASDKKACFNKMINKHIKKNFRYPEIAQEMGIQGKVYMHFIIQKDGSIGDIRIARSPDKNLGGEASRIVHKLPKMKPARQRGNPVRVPFSLPINFVLQ